MTPTLPALSITRARWGAARFAISPKIYSKGKSRG